MLILDELSPIVSFQCLAFFAHVHLVTLVTEIALEGVFMLALLIESLLANCVCLLHGGLILGGACFQSVGVIIEKVEKVRRFLQLFSGLGLLPVSSCFRIQFRGQKVNDDLFVLKRLSQNFQRQYVLLKAVYQFA